VGGGSSEEGRDADDVTVERTVISPRILGARPSRDDALAFGDVDRVQPCRRAERAGRTQ
jgi:hypothetical protein